MYYPFLICYYPLFTLKSIFIFYTDRYMNNINCPDPICVYNEKKQKCIQPNPYIQYLSRCKKNKLSKEECNKNYKVNKDIIKKQACNNYRFNLSDKNIKSCPANRRPVNNTCINKEFKVLKNNNHGIPCCYKEKKPHKSVLINAANKIKDIIKNKQLRDEFKDKQIAINKLQDVIKNKQLRNEFKDKQIAINKLQDVIKNKQLRDEFKDKQIATKTIGDAFKYLKAKKEFKEAKYHKYIYLL